MSLEKHETYMGVFYDDLSEDPTKPWVAKVYSEVEDKHCTFSNIETAEAAAAWYDRSLIAGTRVGGTININFPVRYVEYLKDLGEIQ